MSILICPECNGKVSDKVDACPHCGYLVKNILYNNTERKYTIINGIKYDVTDIVNALLQSDFDIATVDNVSNIISDTYDIAPIELLKPIMDLKDAPKEINCESLSEFTQKQRVIQASKPKCPTCNSPNIKKISSSRKIVGAIGFGLLSKTAKSQFECCNCGYKW